MAIATVNASYIGYGGLNPALGPVQGQIAAGQDSGPLAKTLVATAVVTGDSSSTSSTINLIDGIQKIAQYPITIPFTNVTAPATIGGVANQAVYSGIGATTQLAVGASIVFSGFSNGGNNGTFTINVISTNSVTVTNASSVLEGPNYSAQGLSYKGPVIAAIDISRSSVNDTAAAGIGVVGAHGISNTSFTCDYSATFSGTMGLVFVIYFAS